MEHDPELDAVIKAKHLNVQKACRAWGRGKRVCYDCGFLVNKDGHEERCSTANNIRSSPPDVKENEVPAPAGEDRHHHYEQYLKGGYDEVTEGQEETLYTAHELPDVLVTTIAIPDGLTVSEPIPMATDDDRQRGASAHGK
jgi:ribosomal protein L32